MNDLQNFPESSEDPTTSVRRVTARDRKTRISTGSLFDPGTESQADAKPVTQTRPRTESTRPRTSPTAAQRPKASAKSARRANLISVLFLVGTLAALAYFALLWVDPYTPLNPLAPPTPLPVIVTATPAFNADGAVIVPPLPVTDEQFRVSDAGVRYDAHASGCNWGGVAGRVASAEAYAVRVTGVGLDSGVFSGSAPRYGTGGFEFKLFDAPLQGTVIVQVFGADGTARSEPISVTLRDTCEENIALVEFVAVE